MSNKRFSTPLIDAILDRNSENVSQLSRFLGQYDSLGLTASMYASLLCYNSTNEEDSDSLLQRISSTFFQRYNSKVIGNIFGTIKKKPSVNDLEINLKDYKMLPDSPHDHQACVECMRKYISADNLITLIDYSLRVEKKHRFLSHDDCISNFIRSVFCLPKPRSELCMQSKENGFTSLMFSCMAKSPIATRILLDYESGEQSIVDGTFALQLCAEKNFVEGAKLLLKKENNLSDFQGFSALHIAAEHGNVEIMRILLPFEFGFQRIKDGWTPLMSAVLAKQHKAIEEILRFQNMHLFEYFINEQQSEEGMEHISTTSLPLSASPPIAAKNSSMAPLTRNNNDISSKKNQYVCVFVPLEFYTVEPIIEPNLKNEVNEELSTSFSSPSFSSTNDSDLSEKNKVCYFRRRRKKEGVDYSINCFGLCKFKLHSKCKSSCEKNFEKHRRKSGRLKTGKNLASRPGEGNNVADFQNYNNLPLDHETLETFGRDLQGVFRDNSKKRLSRYNESFENYKNSAYYSKNNNFIETDSTDSDGEEENNDCNLNSFYNRQSQVEKGRITKKIYKNNYAPFRNSEELCIFEDFPITAPEKYILSKIPEIVEKETNWNHFHNSVASDLATQDLVRNKPSAKELLRVKIHPLLTGRLYNNDLTALSIAVLNKDLASVKLLASYEANIKSMKTGKSAYDLALMSRDKQLIDMLNMYKN